MKKLASVFVLAALISVNAFAEHPSGWGVGLVGQGGLAWDGFGATFGPALSLKMPQIPIYWGVNMSLRNSGFGVSVTGDGLVIDQTINSGLNLGWYLGLGVYAGVYSYSGSESGIFLRTGARAPIGIYIFPAEFLEVFFDAAPSLGLGIGIGSVSGLEFPDGGIGADFGLRFWF
jgi:hypothetical protein